MHLTGDSRKWKQNSGFSRWLPTLDAANTQMQVFTIAFDIAGLRQGISALAQLADHVVAFGKLGKFGIGDGLAHPDLQPGAYAPRGFTKHQ